MKEYSERIQATVDRALNEMTTPDFWAEVSPELQTKLRLAAQYIGSEVCVETVRLVMQEIRTQSGIQADFAQATASKKKPKKVKRKK